MRRFEKLIVKNAYDLGVVHVLRVFIVCTKSFMLLRKLGEVSDLTRDQSCEFESRLLRAFLPFSHLSNIVPELFEVQAGVEHGRGIDLHRLAVKTNGERLVVGAAAGQLVTAGAGQGVVDRQARLIEQLATQLNLGRVQYGNRRQGLERFVQWRGCERCSAQA